jgi:hypothetical protein
MGKVLFFMGKGRSAFGASPFFAISVKRSLTEPSAFGFFFSEAKKRWEKVGTTSLLSFFATKKKRKTEKKSQV